MNNYKKYYFLVNGTTLSWDNLLRFRKRLLKWIYNKIMTIDDQIKDEEIQYDINRVHAKISALWSGKINKYEFWKTNKNNWRSSRKTNEGNLKSRKSQNNYKMYL